LSSAPTFVATPLRALLTTANTTGQTILTGGASGSKVVALIATSTNTTVANVSIILGNSTVNAYLLTTTVPGLAGANNSVPAVNLLNPALVPGLPTDNDGQTYLFLANTTDTLYGLSSITVATAQVAIHAIYGNF
jgi:hypothetical protein